MILRRLQRLPLLLLVLLLAACDDPLSSDEVTVDESELTFIRAAENAPALETKVIRFTAVKGEESVVQMRYQYRDGTNGKCLLFRLPADALLRRPDGSAIQTGESVEITIRLVDDTEKRYRFNFEFEPSGLRFDPRFPAEIEVRHRYADKDFNQDGTIDEQDVRIAGAMQIWRQERPLDPWTQISTERLPDIWEARAKITGFTRYALAAD